MFDDILDGLFKETKENNSNNSEQILFDFGCDEESDEWINPDVWTNNTSDFVWTK